MTDKSKFPSIEEISGMAGKLYTDVKKSVGEIVSNYKTKAKTEDTPAAEPSSAAEVEQPTTKVATKPKKAKQETKPKLQEEKVTTKQATAETVETEKTD